jgi:hypothetical protein
VVRVGTSKGSTIRHMAAVHLGALATGSPTEKKKKKLLFNLI